MLTVLGNKVLVKQLQVGNRLDKLGLTEVQDYWKEKMPQQGEVIAVGGDVKEVKVGDKIYFRRNAGDIIVEDRIEYLVMAETEIKLIIPEYIAHKSSSAKETLADDIIQPFTKEGKKNDRFDRVYGEKWRDHIENPEKGGSEADEVIGEAIDRENYEINKEKRKIYV